MIKKILILAALAVMLFTGIAQAAEVGPEEFQRWGTYYYEWTLTTGQTSSGDSDSVAKDVGNCKGIKTLKMTTTGGTVGVSCVIYSDLDADPDPLVAAAAGVDRVSSWDSISKVYTDCTITDGTISNIILSCVSDVQ
jgi:hypothetical protein